MTWQVYERADSFRAEIGNLDLICNIHNNIQRTMLPVEQPLIQDRLDAVDLALQHGLAVRSLAGTLHARPPRPSLPPWLTEMSHARPIAGLQVLTWNAHHIDKRIAEALALVRDTADALAAIQANARRTRELAAQWAARLLFERKDGKASAPPALTVQPMCLECLVPCPPCELGRARHMTLCAWRTDIRI